MAVTRARTNLVDQLRRRPGRTLVVALGTGYLLGGGLATKMTGSLLATVGRVTLRLAIVPLFLDALERNLFGDRASDEADGLTKRPTV
jgi:hypothetical protein